MCMLAWPPTPMDACPSHGLACLSHCLTCHLHVFHMAFQKRLLTLSGMMCSTPLFQQPHLCQMLQHVLMHAYLHMVFPLAGHAAIHLALPPIPTTQCTPNISTSDGSCRQPDWLLVDGVDVAVGRRMTGQACTSRRIRAKKAGRWRAA